MDEPNKDTPASGAPEGITPDGGTPASSPATPPTVYAGKFKSVEDLEVAYKNVESKVGQKHFAEALGQRVVEATGYTVKDLEDAGYTPDQIVQAVISAAPQGQADRTPQENLTQKPLDTIKKTVEDSRIDRIEWNTHVRDFFDDHPEAKEFREEINEFHSLPQYRHLTPEQIFESKLKKVLDKSEHVVKTRQSEKERASLQITHRAAPEPKGDEKARDQFRKTGHFDDAVKFVGSWLSERR